MRQFSKTHRGEPDPGGRSEEIYFSHETKNDASDADDGMIVSVGFGLSFPTLLP